MPAVIPATPPPIMITCSVFIPIPFLSALFSGSIPDGKKFYAGDFTKPEKYAIMNKKDGGFPYALFSSKMQRADQ
jgi:hypothetical protein